MTLGTNIVIDFRSGFKIFTHATVPFITQITSNPEFRFVCLCDQFPIFCGRTLTTNRRPLTVSVVVHYTDRFVVRDAFLSVFGGSSIVTIKMDMEHTFSSRRFDLFGPSSVVACVHILLLNKAQRGQNV